MELRPVMKTQQRKQTLALLFTGLRLSKFDNKSVSGCWKSSPDYSLIINNYRHCCQTRDNNCPKGMDIEQR